MSLFQTRGFGAILREVASLCVWKRISKRISFEDHTLEAGLVFREMSKDPLLADFDNDGDIDWFVNDGNRGILLFENILIDKGKTQEKVKLDSDQVNRW